MNAKYVTEIMSPFFVLLDKNQKCTTLLNTNSGNKSGYTCKQNKIQSINIVNPILNL